MDGGWRSCHSSALSHKRNWWICRRAARIHKVSNRVRHRFELVEGSSVAVTLNTCFALVTSYRLYVSTIVICCWWNRPTVVALIEWFVKYGCIPALEVIPRSMFSSELWPIGTKQNDNSSLAGLNDLQGLLGLWKRLLDSGFRCLRYFEMSLTGQRLEPGLSKIFPLDSSSWSSRPPWWFFVANTATRSLLTS